MKRFTVNVSKLRRKVLMFSTLQKYEPANQKCIMLHLLIKYTIKLIKAVLLKRQVRPRRNIQFISMLLVFKQ